MADPIAVMASRWSTHIDYVIDRRSSRSERIGATAVWVTREEMQSTIDLVNEFVAGIRANPGIVRDEASCRAMSELMTSINAKLKGWEWAFGEISKREADPAVEEEYARHFRVLAGAIGTLNGEVTRMTDAVMR